jgi:hypothetical protein
VQDYNVRLINDTNTRLSCEGNFVATTLTQTSDRNARRGTSSPSNRGPWWRKWPRCPSASGTSSHPQVAHLGPMAQDFKAAFGLGDSDTGIATVDEGGVALAAIQGLNQKVEDRVQALEHEIKRRDTENAALKARLDRLEKLLENRR